MMYVPFGFANPAMFDTTEVVGGSAYGAGTISKFIKAKWVINKPKPTASHQLFIIWMNSKWRWISPAK
jgi:NAD(P)H dehydrogenase (quinone)